MISRRGLLTATLPPAPRITHVQTTTPFPKTAHIAEQLNDPKQGYAIVPIKTLIGNNVNRTVLLDAIARPAPIRVASPAVHHKSIVIPYYPELVDFQRWMTALGCQVARMDKRNIDYADTMVHVRGQKRSTKHEHAHTQKTEVEKWHIDGSFMTCVMCLEGRGTDIAPQYAVVPQDPDTSVKEYLTLQAGQALIMNGGQRHGCKWTVHRAPMTEDDRLAIVAFFSI